MRELVPPCLRASAQAARGCMADGWGRLARAMRLARTGQHGQLSFSERFERTAEVGNGAWTRTGAVRQRRGLMVAG